MQTELICDKTTPKMSETEGQNMQQMSMELT